MLEDPPKALYRLRFQDGAEGDCVIEASPAGIAFEGEKPDWARLGFHQCPHCPLKQDESPYCPFALAMVEPLRVLDGRNSYDPVDVEVLWRERRVEERTTLQRALGSLMGLISASSGCPHTRLLRAMAWFHLPFSNAEETLFRLLGTYLLGQHLRALRGLEADTDLARLPELYGNLRKVNKGVVERLRAASEGDYGINGLILMDLMASDTRDSLTHLEESLEPYFKEYLEK